jgi:hypothetical protein
MKEAAMAAPPQVNTVPSGFPTQAERPAPENPATILAKAQLALANAELAAAQAAVTAAQQGTAPTQVASTFSAPAPAVQAEVLPPEPIPTPGNTESTLAKAPDRTVAVPTKYYEDDEAEGEFDGSDTIRATMTIVAKTGKMSNLFTPGSVLLNKDVVIGGIDSPVTVIPVTIKKMYQNDLHSDLKVMGAIAETAEQVIAKGGIAGEYRPSDDKVSRHYWKPIMKIGFLVKRPANASPAAAGMFQIEIDGEFYAPVRYTARAKTAYNGIAKVLSDIKSNQRSIRATTFNLTSRGEDWAEANKSWIQSNLTPVGPTNPNVIAFIKANMV